MTSNQQSIPVPGTRRLLIGVGNPFRSDDGAGIAVARRIQERLPELRVMEASGEGAQLIDLWQSADLVVVVDAVRSGALPGRVYRLDSRTDRIPSSFFHYSTHAFSVAEAVEVARALSCLPMQLIIYGIEGASFASGSGLSGEVAAAVEDVADRIVAELSGESRTERPDPEEVSRA